MGLFYSTPLCASRVNYEPADRALGWEIRAECTFKHESCIEKLSAVPKDQLLPLINAENKKALKILCANGDTSLARKLITLGAEVDYECLVISFDNKHNAVFQLLLDNISFNEITKIDIPERITTQTLFKNKVASLKIVEAKKAEEAKKLEETKKLEEANAKKLETKPE